MLFYMWENWHLYSLKTILVLSSLFAEFKWTFLGWLPFIQNVVSNEKNLFADHWCQKPFSLRIAHSLLEFFFLSWNKNWNVCLSVSYSTKYSKLEYTQKFMHQKCVCVTKISKCSRRSLEIIRTTNSTNGQILELN